MRDAASEEYKLLEDPDGSGIQRYRMKNDTAVQKLVAALVRHHDWGGAASGTNMLQSWAISCIANAIRMGQRYLEQDGRGAQVSQKF